MIRYEQHGAVAVVRLDRHESRNALDIGHCDQLRNAVESSAADSRAIVITGEGSSFCAGADLTTVYGAEFRTALYRMLGAITAAPVPVIAAVNGPAIGAGTQLALACDLRVAADSARFAIPTAKLGFAVDPWTVRRLVEIAGGSVARRLLLACDQLDADPAYRCGLVDYLGSFGDALARATEIAALAPLTLRYSKLALNTLSLDDSDVPAVTAAYEACWSSTDISEARQASTENRPPVFTGN